MFDKHVKTLEQLLRGSPAVSGDETRDAAVRSALEIMRAAEPKDEAAEREYCMREAAYGVGITATRSVCDLLMRERAALRAHYEARIADMGRPKGVLDEIQRCASLGEETNCGCCVPQNETANAFRRERAAARAEGAATAQAEIARLHMEIMRMNTQDRALQTQLSEARAEIERLRRKHERLREAVASVCDFVTIPGDCEYALRAALEVSK